MIIVFSDHSRRHDVADRDEMIHSLFMGHTPGHPDLFPPDTSPIKILPRVGNAYEGTRPPLASGESVVLDPLQVPKTGYFDLTPWPP